ncbi:hypothetical protein NC652_014146 [Populus alba x Populus x berolinensis]|uniref:Uncharacterized protein n=1 Tax=Populus alba x Populus x berolinensis TaxID=444605 RepID=A0AAD6W4F2_9ROSI|nr:hypothetical protein NC652_014146 [Populus alba x Populus x berolinensis]KAJ6997774.1 hypothetical protein NC653_014113 [Populus alba x Populus x berolinensis]
MLHDDRVRLFYWVVESLTGLLTEILLPQLVIPSFDPSILHTRGSLLLVRVPLLPRATDSASLFY